MAVLTKKVTPLQAAQNNAAAAIGQFDVARQTLVDSNGIIQGVVDANLTLVADIIAANGELRTQIERNAKVASNIEKLLA